MFLYTARKFGTEYFRMPKKVGKVVNEIKRQSIRGWKVDRENTHKAVLMKILIGNFQGDGANDVMFTK